MNRTSVDRGLFRSHSFKKYQETISKNPSTSQDDQFMKPDRHRVTGMKSGNYDKLNEQGFVPLETIVKKNDVIFGKVSPIQPGASNKTLKDSSLLYKSTVDGIVDRVVTGVFDDDGYEMYSMRIRSERRPIVGDKFCLTKEHEVLTTSGWISIDKVTKQHKVATLCDDGSVEYVNPIDTYEFDYDGQLYQLKSQQVDLTTTLDHMMYIKKRNGKEFELVKAKDMKGKRVKFKKDGFIDEPYQEHFELNDMEPSTVKMDDWLEFLGIWISDGSIELNPKRNGYKICIAATKKRKVDYINDICKRLELKVSSSGGNHTVFNKHMYRFLEPYAVGALNKYLPDFVWDLGTNQARILLNSLISGDGSKNNNGSVCYCTSSKKLADDVSRLALHAGWSGSIKVNREKGTEWCIEGRTGTLNADTLSVRIVKSKNTPQINHGHTKDQNGQSEEYIDYKGKVYCLEVPSHVFYVRLNDKPVWTGNCSRHGQKGTIGIILPNYDMPTTKDGLQPDIIINPQCLTGDTVIRSSNGEVKYIKDIYKSKLSLTTIDPDSLKISNTEYIDGFVRDGDNLKLITTVTGRKVKCTDDHKFLVWNGNKTVWKETKDLMPYQDKILIHHSIDPVPTNDGEDLVFAMEKNAYYNRLNDLGFIGNVTHKKTMILARLLGLIKTDGHIHKRNKNVKSVSVRGVLYVGEQGDVEEVLADIKELGFKTPPYRKAQSSITIELEPALAYFFHKLGRCLGNKVEVVRVLPDWIKEAHSDVKREFLSGFQGGDGSKLSVNIKTEQQQIRIRPINMRSSTIEAVYNSHKKYMTDLQELYEEFDIKTTVQEYATKQDDKVDFKLCVSSVPINLNKYIDTIGYRYCNHKRRNSRCPIEYLKSRMNGIRFEYTKFEKCFKAGDLVTTFIESIEDIPNEPVYDFTTVSDNHSFIANSLVSHNCIPSRMTIAQLIECITGKVAAIEGHYIDGTPFNQTSIEGIREALKKHGFDENGYETLYCGMTGKKMKVAIFMGPTYYLRLKHLVKDKIHSRSKGPRLQLTRQPPEGKWSINYYLLKIMVYGQIIPLIIMQIMVSLIIHEATSSNCGKLRKSYNHQLTSRDVRLVTVNRRTQFGNRVIDWTIRSQTPNGKEVQRLYGDGRKLKI
jgi:intein/homing endonuclease